MRDSNDIEVLYRLFKKTQFFSQINEAALNAICKVASHVQVHAGEPVVEQNDAGDSFYVILSGYLEVRVRKRERSSIAERHSTRRGRYTQIGGLQSRELQRTESMALRKRKETEILGLDDDESDKETENEDQELSDFLKADANSEYGDLVGVISAGDSL